MDKQSVYTAALNELEGKIDAIQDMLNDINSALADDNKSTAGDKHETSRAMAQREHEQVSIQMNQLLDMKRMISAINPNQSLDSVQFGSLVETTSNWLFFSVGIGKINANDTEVFCISAATPLGKTILGKTKGDKYEFGGKKFEILTVL